ncbi:hypothetical protein [Micromonospora sp. NPDC049107]|uniref:hypothetical protein n=1 Tax=unclassified Micromonospora TaxID=2617518 RepID=UPI0033ECFEBB
MPLPDSVAQVLRQHIKDCEPVTLTLPWENPADDERVSGRFCLPAPGEVRSTGAPSTTRVGAPPWCRPASRRPGPAACTRYASSLLDAGESIKALASYLGHADPGFTLRVYTHLMPVSEERTRNAIDTLFGKGL